MSREDWPSGQYKWGITPLNIGPEPHLRAEKPTLDSNLKYEDDPEEPLWNLYTCGASNEDGSGAGLILISPEGIELTYAVRLDFPSTNTEAEYEALLAGLRMAKKLKAHVDSLLVANQVKGDYEAKDTKLVENFKKVKELLQSFEEYEVVHISQGLNKNVGARSKLPFVAFDHLAKDFKVKTTKQPSIMEATVANVEVSGEN
ncbi:uncharacterized protein LOC143620976 [Bidens hawaiensis]|uniref:uncharacterized protein LOC143620976 n=1 Tax=Bidens hawaiensis TaxID=980011 RepID=UPI00404A7D86